MFTSHHLRQILKSKPSLVDNLIESVCWTNSSNYDLITPGNEAFVCLINVCVDWHTKLPTAFVAYVVV